MGTWLDFTAQLRANPFVVRQGPPRPLRQLAWDQPQPVIGHVNVLGIPRARAGVGNRDRDNRLTPGMQYARSATSDIERQCVGRRAESSPTAAGDQAGRRDCQVAGGSERGEQ